MKAISIIVGAVLLGAGIFLAFLSNTHEVTLKNNKELISKYCKIANEALNNNDTKKAIKYAKMAIVVDPKNKEGFQVLEKIYQSKYQVSNQQVPAVLPGIPGMPPMPSQTPSMPQPQETQEEDDMGC